MNNCKRKKTKKIYTLMNDSDGNISQELAAPCYLKALEEALQSLGYSVTEEEVEIEEE